MDIQFEINGHRVDMKIEGANDCLLNKEIYINKDKKYAVYKYLGPCEIGYNFINIGTKNSKSHCIFPSKGWAKDFVKEMSEYFKEASKLY